MQTRIWCALDEDIFCFIQANCNPSCVSHHDCVSLYYAFTSYCHSAARLLLAYCKFRLSGLTVLFYACLVADTNLFYGKLNFPRQSDIVFSFLFALHSSLSKLCHIGRTVKRVTLESLIKSYLCAHVHNYLTT